MPANSRSTRSSSNASKKTARKGTKKATKKATGKGAKKATGKVAKKVNKKVTRKTARRSQISRKKVIEVPAERRHEMIEKAAYYRAEKRHFQGGDPVADWLTCEKEIDVLLSKTVL